VPSPLMPTPPPRMRAAVPTGWAADATTTPAPSVPGHGRQRRVGGERAGGHRE
jgi:hypothetical protein